MPRVDGGMNASAPSLKYISRYVLLLADAVAAALRRHFQLREADHRAGGRQVVVEGADTLCYTPDAEVRPAHGHKRLLPGPPQRPGELHACA